MNNYLHMLLCYSLFYCPHSLILQQNSSRSINIFTPVSLFALYVRGDSLL